MALIYGVNDPLRIIMCLSIPFQNQLNKITKNDYYIIENCSWIIIMLLKQITHDPY